MVQNSFAGKTFWVVAEVSGLRYYSGKNYYFLNLVEKAPESNSLLTTIAATVWSHGVNRIRRFESLTGQKFDNNLQLLLQVRVEYHIAYGLKLNILDVDPSFTLGKLAMEKQLTLDRLVEENPGFVMLTDGEYSSFNKLRIPPTVIQRIALIGSPGTDGFRDFIHEIESNLYDYKFQIDEYPAPVQGVGADLKLVEKLIEIVSLEINYDAVAIVRGGGADTDLIAFNSYRLSRAIARFPIPIITGIGHTRNESIADLMAWRSLKTPTKVAAFIIDHNKSFEDQLLLVGSRIFEYAPALVSRKKEQLHYLNTALQGSMKEVTFVHRQNLNELRNSFTSHALTGLRNRSGEVQSILQMVKQATKHLLVIEQNRLSAMGQTLKMMGPEKILKRGFSLVFHNGKLVKDAALLKPGSAITTQFHDGRVTSEVTDVNLSHGEDDL